MKITKSDVAYQLEIIRKDIDRTLSWRDKNMVCEVDLARLHGNSGMLLRLGLISKQEYDTFYKLMFPEVEAANA